MSRLLIMLLATILMAYSGGEFSAEYTADEPDEVQTKQETVYAGPSKSVAVQSGELSVDFIIDEDYFAHQISDIATYPENYLGMNIEIEGYVHRYAQGQDEYVQFAVLRDYDAGEGEYIPYGLDCYFEGDMPEDGEWVLAVGTLAAYEEDGAEYLMLAVHSLERLDEQDQGSRVVIA